MAPKKRKSDAGGSTGPSAKKLAVAGVSISDLAAKENAPYVQAVMQLFEDAVRGPNKQIYEVLDEAYPTSSDREAFCRWIETSFPCSSDLAYIEDFASGPKILRAWQLSWHPNSGNSGCASHDQMQKLVTLICMNGFQSNSDLHIAMEKLAVTAPNPKLYGGRLREYPKISNYKLGHQDPHHRHPPSPLLSSFLWHRLVLASCGPWGPPRGSPLGFSRWPVRPYLGHLGRLDTILGSLGCF